MCNYTESSPYKHLVSFQEGGLKVPLCVFILSNAVLFSLKKRHFGVAISGGLRFYNHFHQEAIRINVFFAYLAIICI